MKGRIFNIERFATKDGPGIRTVVFLKGCPLSCAWCHNPESQSNETKIPCNNKKNITLKAPDFYEKEIEADEVLEKVLRDKDFYDESGGGITLSGGEPLMQYDFSLEILKKAKENGIHTAIETSGYSCRDLAEISEYVDLWLYDVKLFDDNSHKKYIGASNEIIQKNLSYLNRKGAKIILRCPIIPDINLTKEHFENIAKLSERMKNVISINVELYHPLGIDKAKRLGKALKYENDKFLTEEEVIPFIEFMKNITQKEIKII